LLHEILKEQQQQKLLEKFMKRQHLAIILVTVAVIAASLVTLVLLGNTPVDREPVHYTYNVVNVYPHDESAFTQGLVFEDGFLYEGTGLYGQSTLRRVELETGNVIQPHSLSDQFFGEGITIFEDKIVQLTWKSGKGFVYDRSSFELLQEFEYPTQGWGITHDCSRLIMSDGTATLYFLDPETFQTIGQVEVYDKEPVTSLNELEYINGSVYANIWKKDQIAIINPETGKVTGWIDLSSINGSEKTTENVLNGIAYDQNGDRLFVTGKMWSKLFEIELVPKE
jgi:glutamine cyclotransferase